GCRCRVGELVALPGRFGLHHDHRALPHPGDIAQNGLSVLESAAATPGVVKPEALVAPEPEPAPGWDPKPDPTLTTASLQVTELLPDSTNVGASDGYEFIDLYNATSAAAQVGAPEVARPPGAAPV
ncbi:MAG: hypothetical protein JWQ59_1179, partial [Cryobacterium sp.]|nr:hypothetical protein [Cryobacterium sp.]